MRLLLFASLCVIHHLRHVAAEDLCGVSLPAARSTRIIRGDETRQHQFPWTVSIAMNGKHHCGGVLLSDSFVLSAVHCFINGTDLMTEAAVLVGAHNLRDGGTLVLGTVIPHPRARRDVLLLVENDLALIRLHEPLVAGLAARPVCLPGSDEETLPGSQVLAVGWGKETTLWDKYNSDVMLHPIDLTLKQLLLEVQDTDGCMSLVTAYSDAVVTACQTGRPHKRWCRDVFLSNKTSLPQPLVGRTTICAANRGGLSSQRRSLCQGDSGGPLMQQRPDGSWVVVGIASTVVPDCIVRLKDFPQPGAFFASVRHSLAWIQATALQMNAGAVHRLQLSVVLVSLLFSAATRLSL